MSTTCLLAFSTMQLTCYCCSSEYHSFFPPHTLPVNCTVPSFERTRDAGSKLAMPDGFGHSSFPVGHFGGRECYRWAGSFYGLRKIHSLWITGWICPSRLTIRRLHHCRHAACPKGLWARGLYWSRHGRYQNFIATIITMYVITIIAIIVTLRNNRETQLVQKNRHYKVETRHTST